MSGWAWIRRHVGLTAVQDQHSRHHVQQETNATFGATLGLTPDEVSPLRIEDEHQKTDEHGGKDCYHRVAQLNAAFADLEQHVGACQWPLVLFTRVNNRRMRRILRH